MSGARPMPAPNSVLARSRKKFGLDTLLPADPAVIEADVLRLLRDAAPDVLILRPSDAPDRPPPAGHRAIPRLPRGVPDLLLLGQGGRTACLNIRTQAGRPTREQAAFEDLCRERAIPFATVRSTAEARVALIRHGLLGPER